MQGRSMVPLLKGGGPVTGAPRTTTTLRVSAASPRGPTLWRAQRDRLQAGAFYQTDEWELFDLNKDPNELKSLYSNADYAGVKESLTLQMKELQVKYETPTPQHHRRSKAAKRRCKATAKGRRRARGRSRSDLANQGKALGPPSAVMASRARRAGDSLTYLPIESRRHTLSGADERHQLADFTLAHLLRQGITPHLTMIKLTGIADEAGASLDVQIQAHQELGWDGIESRGVEFDGVKGNLHEIPDSVFDKVVAHLEEKGMKVSGFGSLIGNWAKKIGDDFSVTEAEIDRAIPRMQRLGAKLIRVMSYAVCKDADGKELTKQFADERIKRLRIINQRFADAGLTVVHENCMNWAGMSPTYVQRMAEAVPGMKWVFDTGNPVFIDDRDKPGHKQDAWEMYQAVKPSWPTCTSKTASGTRRRMTPFTPTPARAKARPSAS